MTMTTTYALPEGHRVVFAAKKQGKDQHKFSIRFGKGKNKVYVIKDCVYKDSYVEIKTYMDDEENHFQILCSNCRNITSFMVDFYLDEGIAVMRNRIGWLDCPGQFEVRV